MRWIVKAVVIVIDAQLGQPQSLTSKVQIHFSTCEISKESESYSNNVFNIITNTSEIVTVDFLKRIITKFKMFKECHEALVNISHIKLLFFSALIDPTMLIVV